MINRLIILWVIRNVSKSQAHHKSWAGDMLLEGLYMKLRRQLIPKQEKTNALPSDNSHS